jgi:ATP-dependent Clp protease ATP-binding subunit ClpA
VRLPAPAESVPALIPFDADARKVLELTFRTALRLGHNYVGTEHLLLALLDVEGDAGPLAALGVTRTATETAIAEALAAAVRSADA